MFAQSKRKKHIVNENSKFHRPDSLPKILTFEGHLYTFQYRLKDENLYKYQCKYGTSKSTQNKCKCEASIGIPVMTSKENLEDVEIVVLKKEHTCQIQTKTIAKLISEAEIKQKAENIFTSVKPRPSKNQLIALLGKQIQEETPEGEEPQMVSSYLVSSYYSELCKKHATNDEMFRSYIMTQRGTNLELFKLEYPDTIYTRKRFINDLLLLRFPKIINTFSNPCFH